MQLAALLGLSQAAVANWERGGNSITLANLTAVAEALGVDMVTFFGELADGPEGA